MAPTGKPGQLTVVTFDPGKRTSLISLPSPGEMPKMPLSLRPR